jgi:hypothetical protein
MLVSTARFFFDMVQNIWNETKRGRSALSFWHRFLVNSSRILKGLKLNIEDGNKKKRMVVSSQIIDTIGKKSEITTLSPTLYNLRCELAVNLNRIMGDEIKWRQRSKKMTC